MNSAFNPIVILEYSKIFDEETDLKTLLTGISKSTLLKVSSFFLGFSNEGSKYFDPKDFLAMYFQKENNTLANEIYDKIKVYQKSTKNEITIPNTLTSLYLFEYAFQHLDENENLSSAEIEIRVFKAYLLINESHALNVNKAKETTQSGKPENHLSEFLFTMAYADSDLINFDTNKIFTSQIVKSIMLFEMLEQDKSTTLLLRAFLKHFECENWKEYLKSILPIVFSIIMRDNEAHIDIILKKDEHYNRNLAFFQKLTIKDDTTLSEHDFSSVRANPIYQADETTFRIVFPLFAIEMLHKGLYFKLSNINDTLSKEEGKIAEFRGFYCDNFSENYLLYETMHRMLGKRYKKFTGQQMKDAGLVAEPDYYFRNGNKIFLFESKDVFIRADIKGSFDFVKLDSALKEKFYFVEKKGGGIKKKAVLQLINSIKNILSKNFIVDSQYNEKKVIIYPILVTHHHQFDVIGLNNIIKSWFDDELMKLAQQHYIVNNIKPITIINIDDLILYQDLFLQKQITLEELIDSYIDYVSFNKKKKYRSEQELINESKNTLIPFATFSSNYIQKKKLRAYPNILREKGLTLFEQT